MAQNISAAIDLLEKVAGVVEQLGPALGAMGVPYAGNLGVLAAAAAAIAQDVQGAVSSEQAVTSAEDQATLNLIIENLMQAATALAAQVDQS
jgi:hypothetical protein